MSGSKQGPPARQGATVPRSGVTVLRGGREAGATQSPLLVASGDRSLAGRQAGRQAGKQVGRQAGRQNAGRQTT